MSTNLGEIMRSEIAEIPAVFQKLSDQIPEISKAVDALSLTNIDSVILVARGTSDNAALFLKYLIETKIGIPCGLASPSVVTIYKSNLRFTNTLVIGISQSGQSPDIVSYTKAAKAGGAKSISFTNDPDSPLAKATDLHLYLEAGTEKAVAATKSYSAELLLSYIFVSIWAKQSIDLTSLISASNDAVGKLAKVSEIVDAFDHKFGITTMGRGFAYANAQECALKIQETLKIPVSSFSSADYLHGPISSLTQNSRVVFLAPSGVAHEAMDKTVNRIREITKHLYWIGSGFPSLTGEVSIGGSTGLTEQESVIVDSIVLQQFAMTLAIKNNLNPDAPAGLLKVTQTI
ncbi:MAG: SIS domain-containing protein [Actinobacteria bacterium]|nr:SIS domain-containing protein [Actinomycetota bacterium]